MEQGKISVTERGHLEDNLDLDNDGVVSSEEMRLALRFICVRADVLLVRMAMEKELAIMIRKLPLFIVCILAFLLGLLEFTPPEATSDIHQHLHTHFGLGDLSGINNFEQIYDFIEHFAEQNAELEANSYKYWCEDRYADYFWDHTLSVPRWTCASARQFALGLADDAGWSWTRANDTGPPRREGFSGSQGGNSDAGGPAGSRRLADASDANGMCEDDDFGLQAELGRASATCRDHLDVCDLELGMTLCPHTCGYCGPFEYRHTQFFPKAQSSMLPVAVFQTRSAPSSCRGFAATYEDQPVNPALWQTPALDGNRQGKLMHCTDRSRTLEDDFAMERDCPDFAPQGGPRACPAGSTFKVTPRSEFDGTTIYPEILANPSHNLAQLRALQWLDVQTESVSVGTMVYTEGVEIFTSLTVSFRFGQSGKVHPSFRVVSYRDMIGGSRAVFIACMTLTSVFALLGMLLSIYNSCKFRSECKVGVTVYELTSRSLLMVFPVALLLSWSQQELMSARFEDLLSSFLGADGASEESWRRVTDDFFDVHTRIYQDTSWLNIQRVAAYLVLYFQFLQLLFYLSAHPKMGVLTATIHRATTQLIHFGMLFTALYVTLGFMAHWMLGEHVREFSTMSETMKQQSQMLLGEEFIPAGVNELSEGFTVMFWVYAATFMLVIFFTLLNFFLAIIVDAFCDVKDSAGKHAILGNFFIDMWRVFYINCKWKWRGWPTRRIFLAYWTEVVAEQMSKSWLDELASEEGDEDRGEMSTKVLVTPEQILENIPDLEEEHLCDILAFYFALSGRVLCRRASEGAPVSRQASPSKAHVADESLAESPTADSAPAKPGFRRKSRLPATESTGGPQGMALAIARSREASPSKGYVARSREASPSKAHSTAGSREASPGKAFVAGPAPVEDAAGAGPREVLPNLEVQFSQHIECLPNDSNCPAGPSGDCSPESGKDAVSTQAEKSTSGRMSCRYATVSSFSSEVSSVKDSPTKTRNKISPRSSTADAGQPDEPASSAAAPKARSSEDKPPRRAWGPGRPRSQTSIEWLGG